MIGTVIFLYSARYHLRQAQLHHLTLGLWPGGRGCRFFLWSELCLYCVAVARRSCDTEGPMSAWRRLLRTAAGLPLTCWCPLHGILLSHV